MSTWNEQSDIWTLRLQLLKARREFMQQAMVEFDKRHAAQMLALQTRCRELGHQAGRAFSNPIGYLWCECIHCGARMDMEGPSGELLPDQPWTDAERAEHDSRVQQWLAAEQQAEQKNA